MRPQPRMTNMKVGRGQTSDAAQLNGAAKFNGATQLARAFVTYALVPYLGILFCPGAGLLGCLGLWRARRQGQHASARAARRCIILSLFIFSAQMFIWWLLYRVK